LSLSATIFVVVAEGKASTEKQKDIKRLMVLTGAGTIGIQVMNQMMASFKKALPQVPIARIVVVSFAKLRWGAEAESQQQVTS